MAISNTEKGLFLTLFNRSGYVLDFSTAGFDSFTASAVGVQLCAKYGMSKGRSLGAFINEASDKDCFTLFEALLKYYEANYSSEYDKDEPPQNGLRYSSKYAGLFRKCSEIINREGSTGRDTHASSAEYLKQSFSSEYMGRSIDALMAARNDNPTEAIGKSKELIESCCKTILEEQGIVVDKHWDMPKLVGRTMDSLGLSASNIEGDEPSAQYARQILGSLRGVAKGVFEFRNAYGSGHGRGARFVEAPLRHAKLAVGASVAIAEYLWESYEWRKSQGLINR